MKYVDRFLLNRGILPRSILKKRIPYQDGLDCSVKHDYNFVIKDDKSLEKYNYGHAIFIIENRILPACRRHKTPSFVDFDLNCDSYLMPSHSNYEWYDIIEILGEYGFNYVEIYGDGLGRSSALLFLNPSTESVFDFRCLIKSDLIDLRPPLYDKNSYVEKYFLGRSVVSYTKKFDCDYSIVTSKEIFESYWKKFLTDDSIEKGYKSIKYYEEYKKSL